MTTRKLLILAGGLLLVPVGPAGAEEGLPAEAAAEMPAEATGTEPAAEAPAEIPAEETAAEPAEAMPESVEPGPTEEQPAEAWAAEEMPTEASAGELPAAAPPAAEAAPAPAGDTLGIVGYDAEGREGRIHIVVRGDTLWDISDAYLGTPWVWPSIWQDNSAIANPHRIFPGDRIWITPWEMRKLTDAEAEALMAGIPAAPEPEPLVVEPEPVAPAPAPEMVVREEAPRMLVADRDKVGLVTADVVEASASIVSQIGNRVMLSQEDRVWLGLGEDEAAVGDQFTVYRVQEKVYDPESGRMLGYHVDLLGWLEVTEVHEETSQAVIRESSADMVRGDKIMPREDVPREISLQPSPGADVNGQIAFMAGQRRLAGTLEYVYLNRGTLDGVEVGAPLEVYRQGFMTRDRVRGERVEVPDRVIAELVVVKAEAEVAVALIRHTEEELARGDWFRGASTPAKQARLR